MIDFLKYCDFQAGFSILAFFCGSITFIAFLLVADEKIYHGDRKPLLKWAKVFLFLLLLFLFLMAVTPTKEELLQIVQ